MILALIGGIVAISFGLCLKILLDKQAARTDQTESDLKAVMSYIDRLEYRIYKLEAEEFERIAPAKKKQAK